MSKSHEEVEQRGQDLRDYLSDSQAKGNPMPNKAKLLKALRLTETTWNNTLVEARAQAVELGMIIPRPTPKFGWGYGVFDHGDGKVEVTSGFLVGARNLTTSLDTERTHIDYMVRTTRKGSVEGDMWRNAQTINEAAAIQRQTQSENMELKLQLRLAA